MKETAKMSNIDKLIEQFQEAHERDLCVFQSCEQDISYGVLVVDVPMQRKAVVKELICHVEKHYPQVRRINEYTFSEYVRIGFWYDHY
jgi:hypothetical protein